VWNSKQTISDVSKLFWLKVVRVSARYHDILNDWIIADVLKCFIPYGFDWLI
jgi:hypothetical protein